MTISCQEYFFASATSIFHGRQLSGGKKDRDLVQERERIIPQRFG
jgi:hypothetical protein